MDFSSVKLSCSRLGAVMSEPRGALTDKMFDRLEWINAKESRTPNQEIERIELQFRMDNYDPTVLSTGCMFYLMFVYQYMKYGRQKHKMPSIYKASPQLVKGSKMEKSAFNLIKKLTGQTLFRNKYIIQNDFLKGQLDIIDAKTVKDSSKIIDIKTSYTQFDFMKCVSAKHESRSNCFQMQGYLGLTGKEYGEVYHVLTDFTEEAIEAEKIKMIEILCPDGVVTDYFDEEWQMAENSMRFAHIPNEERVIVQRIERDDKIIGKIYEKVDFCRSWLSSFEETHMNKIASQLEQWHQTER